MTTCPTIYYRGICGSTVYCVDFPNNCVLDTNQVCTTLWNKLKNTDFGGLIDSDCTCQVQQCGVKEVDSNNSLDLLSLLAIPILLLCVGQPSIFRDWFGILFYPCRRIKECFGKKDPEPEL